MKLVPEMRQYIAATSAVARANVVGFVQRVFAAGDRIGSNDLDHMPIALVFRPDNTLGQTLMTVGRDPSFSTEDLIIDIAGLVPDQIFVLVLMPGETLFCTSAAVGQTLLATVMV